MVKVTKLNVYKKIKLHKGLPEDLYERYLAKSIHLVCIAQTGLTCCSLYAEHIGGVSHTELEQMVARVNKLNETGTFWPRLPLTIIPEIDSFSPYHREDSHDDLIRTYFVDVVTANQNHIKSTDIALDIHGYPNESIEIAIRALSEDPNIENIWYLI